MNTPSSNRNSQACNCCLFIAQSCFQILIITRLIYLFCTAETLWEYIHNSTIEDEQCLLNHGMQDLGVRWKETTKRKFCTMQSGWQHYGPLSSIIFPQSMFCRQCCKRGGLDGYYVVHPNSLHLNLTLKYRKLKGLKSWFLRDNWKDFISSSLEGKAWLYSIYNT